MKQYISIDMTAMKDNELSIEEWIFLENIHFLSNNEYHACYASKKTIAKYFSISERKIYQIIINLERKSFLIKTELKHLKVTKKWLDIISEKNAYRMHEEENYTANNSVKSMNKLHTKKEYSKKDIKLSLNREEKFKNFKEFRDYCIDNQEGIEFTLNRGNPIKYLPSTVLKIKNSCIFNMHKEDFLAREEAFETWNYLFRNQELILKTSKESKQLLSARI